MISFLCVARITNMAARKIETQEKSGCGPFCDMAPEVKNDRFQFGKLTCRSH